MEKPSKNKNQKSRVIARSRHKEILSLVLTILEERKALDVKVIDLEGKTSIGDYMVIASGQSSRQIVTLADLLVRSLKEAKISGIKPEGRTNGDWILIDAGDVIVHLFRPEVRDFYNLEKMWEPSLEPEKDVEQPKV
ncbi:MAG: ribosome silencing factor [Rhodospirillaceae bacterium]